MPQCCFAGCHNRTDDGRGLSFFRFPRRDLTRTAAWVVACGRKDFSPSQHSRVCSRHFSAVDFDRDARHDSHGAIHRRLRLRDTAVPTTSPVDNPWQNTDNIAGRKTQKMTLVARTNSMEVPVPVIKESAEDFIPMCTPAKRLAVGIDVLDLSRKSSVDDVHNPSDVIILSEDDDEKNTQASSDTEKENAPLNKNTSDVTSLLISLENELRQEEATLMLLQKLHDSQNPTDTSARSAPKSTLSASHSSSSLNATGTIGQKTTCNLGASQKAASVELTKALPSVITPPSSNSVPKVTKQAALQSLEQLYATKKAVLRKQIERNLEKVNLPRPATGSGFCEIAFIPSTLTSDFTALLGLEEVVKTIQDFDPSNLGKPSETRCTFNPFSCVKCGTDFTPVWKREKAGSTNVVCEACLTGTQRLSLKKEYEESVQQVIQLQIDSGLEIEKEYQDLINTPAKLDAYIKDQEKKLLATHQAQQQQLAQQQASYGQRYNKTSVNTTASNICQTTSAVVGGTSVAAAAHQRSRVAATVNGTNVSSVASPTTIASSNQAVAQAAAAAQFAFQQYAKAISGASTTYAASPTTTAALMMAATGAGSQQQQAAAAAAVLQQQQRLAAAQILSSLQAQQQQQQVASVATPAPNDQVVTALNQIPNLLMSSALIGEASRMNFRSLPTTEEDAVKFFQGRGLLAMNQRCRNNHPMKLYFGAETFWKCNTRHCCQHIKIRSGNWFSNSRLPFVTITRFVYLWAWQMTSGKLCHRELGIRKMALKSSNKRRCDVDETAAGGDRFFCDERVTLFARALECWDLELGRDEVATATATTVDGTSSSNLGTPVDWTIAELETSTDDTGVGVRVLGEGADAEGHEVL